MDLKFVPAEPALDNPWAEAVAEIAGKTDEKSGKPLALMTTIPFPDETNESAVKEYERLLRQAHQAGRENTPPVTVRKTVSDVQERSIEKGRGANKTTVTEKFVEVTIWTVPQQKRPRGADARAEATPADSADATPDDAAEARAYAEKLADGTPPVPAATFSK